MAPRLAAVLELVPKGQGDKRPLLDDAEILGAVRRGDRDGASALYRRVRPRVDQTIARILGRRDGDHDDLAQQSMIEIVRSIPGFRGDCSLDTWTSRITAHTVFKELRRRCSQKSVFESAREVRSQDPAPLDVDRDLTLRSLLGRVRKHLDAMDPIKAWAVVLHDVCGYDLREIAEITEASVAATQSRLVRGRAELHERIEADPELTDALEGRGGR